MVQIDYSLTSNSCLSDDFIMTADVLASMSTSSTVGVYTSATGTPAALFITASGTLSQIVQTAGQSAGGWSVSPVGLISGVTQVVVGTQNDGTVHAFYTDGGNTYHIALGTGGWSQTPDTLAHLGGLGVTINPTTGELVAYGVEGSGLGLVFQDTASKAWSVTSLRSPTDMTGLAPSLLLTDDTDDWVMAAPGTASSGGCLNLFQGSPTAITSGPTPVAFTNPIQQVVLAFYGNNSAMFIVTDDKGQVFCSVQSTSSLQLIATMTISQAAALVDSSNNIHLYMIDESGTLSVVHQTGWAAGSGPTWTPAIPIDTGLTAVYADTNTLDTGTLFAKDQGGVLWHYVQDPASNRWLSGKAQTPGPTSYRVPLYRTEVAVADTNGSPAGNLSLTVTASAPTAVIQGGMLQRLGPTSPITISTSPLGKATFSIVASDVSSPTLTFTAAGSALGTANPAVDVQGYLAGTSTSLNAGSSGQLDTFSGPTIQNAKVGGSALAPATQDPNNGATLANSAASGIQAMFQVKPAGGGTVVPAAASHVGFALDMSDRANPKFTTFATDDEYHAYRRTALSVGAALGSGSSWWNDVEDFASDVWDGIKNAAIDLTHIVVHVAEAVADMTVKIADEIHQITGAIIHGIEEVVSAVQGIFAWIGAEIEKLIDWLKALLDWGDILNTSKALQSALSGAFTYLQGVVKDQAEPLVDGFFAKLESQVTTAFDTVAANVAAGAALGSLVPAGSSRYAPAGAGHTLGAAPGASRPAVRAAAGGSVTPSDVHGWQGGTQNNWLLEKLESFLGEQPSLQAVDGLADAFDTLKTAFDVVIADFEKAFNDFATFWTTALSDPQEIATVGLAALIEAAKEVALAVLTFLDGIIEALLKVFAAALGAADQILTAELDVPFLTAIWSSVGELFDVDLPELSVSGVFCTALAIPITILYKIVKGVDQQPFPGGVLPTGASPALRRTATPTANIHAASLAAGAGSASFGAEASSGETDGFKFTAAGIAALWALMDTGLDCVPDCDLMVFNILDLLAPTLIGVFTWPGGVPFQAVPLDTPEDKAAFANWIISFVPVALGMGTMLTGACAWLPKAKVPRYIDPPGKVLLTAGGAINLVSGIVASSLGADGASIAGNIVGPLPVLLSFLRLDSLNPPSEDLALPWALKLVADFFFGEGAAVAIAVS